MTKAKKKTGKPKRKLRPIRAPKSTATDKAIAEIEAEAAAEAARMAPPPPPSAKRIGMTLRLDPEMWVRLKNLSARLSVKLGRPVSAHELVVAGVKTLLLSYEAADVDAHAEDD